MESKKQFNERRQERYVCPSVKQVDIKLYQTSSVMDERINRVVTKRKLVSIDRCKLMSAYRVSDFSIESQVALGTNMSRVSLSPSADAIIDNLSDSLSD